MDAQRVGAAVFFAIGLGALGGAGLVYRSAAALRERGRPVVGTVVSVGEGRKPDGEAYAVVDVEWTAPTGQKRTHRTFGQDALAFHVGERMDLLYDPEDPEHPVSAGFGDRFATVAALGTLGLVFAGIGARASVRRRASTA